jgi:large-conductance mechanosensitive channel
MGGIGDWFVPSKKEVDQNLVNQVTAETVMKLTQSLCSDDTVVATINIVDSKMQCGHDLNFINKGEITVGNCGGAVNDENNSIQNAINDFKNDQSKTESGELNKFLSIFDGEGENDVNQSIKNFFKNSTEMDKFQKCGSDLKTMAETNIQRSDFVVAGDCNITNIATATLSECMLDAKSQNTNYQALQNAIKSKMEQKDLSYLDIIGDYIKYIVIAVVVVAIIGGVGMYFMSKHKKNNDDDEEHEEEDDQ